MDFHKNDAKYHCGVDLHAKSIYVCVMEQTGNILLHREFKTDPVLFKEKIINRFGSNLVVAVESTYNYYWLADVCNNNNIKIALSHAYYIKSIHGNKKKNDSIDSKMLANLSRTFMLPKAYAYPEKTRSTRDLLRKRHLLVNRRAEHYRHIKSTFQQQGINSISLKNIKNKSERKNLLTYFSNYDITLSISVDLNIIEALDENIKTLEKRIYEQAIFHNKKDYNILKSIPGCGQISTLNILYETDNILRFDTHQQFSSYSRVVKSQHVSAGRTYSSKMNKMGNPYLKWTFSEITIHSIMYNANIQKYYNKLVSKFNKIKAKSILMHKFAICVYYMLKNRKVFDEKRFINN